MRQPGYLEQLRRRKPWTQKELAEAAGVSIGTVRGIEHGYYKTVRPRVIRAISAALGVEPAAIIEFRPSLGLPPVNPASESDADDEDYAALQTKRAC